MYNLIPRKKLVLEVNFLRQYAKKYQRVGLDLLPYACMMPF